MTTNAFQCPYCNQNATITGDITSRQAHSMHIENSEGPIVLNTTFLICPNKKCRRFILSANLLHLKQNETGRWVENDSIQSWRLVPPSNAKVYPAFIPLAILQDYREACLIKELSPKASATLARRCLQGIMRDYYGAKPGRLVDEIESIRSAVEPLIWDAIDGTRRIGNIGAHMEKDINLIVDVDPNEAELLIYLLETLFKECYIARHERQERLTKIAAIAQAKKPVTP